MKTRIVAVLAVMAVLAVAFAAVAAAASQKTTNGTLSSFSWDKTKKVGHAVVKVKSSRLKFKVPAKATCGESRGQSGGPVPCSSLVKSKYRNKPVTVRWQKVGATRVVSFISVHLH